MVYRLIYSSYSINPPNFLLLRSTVIPRRSHPCKWICGWEPTVRKQHMIS
eukprot:COSAG01_NODE_34409_length_548_cov_0.795100_2_plen_49_part_01